MSSALSEFVYLTPDGMEKLRAFSAEARGRFMDLLAAETGVLPPSPEDAELLAAGYAIRAVDGVRLTPAGRQIFPAGTDDAAADFKSLREQARDSVACSKCGALAGEPCVGWRGKERASVHAERIVLWRTVRNRRNWRGA